ncbi:hypothetical protein [Erwinia sp. SLM-02]
MRNPSSFFYRFGTLFSWPAWLRTAFILGLVLLLMIMTKWAAA